MVCVLFLGVEKLTCCLADGLRWKRRTRKLRTRDSDSTISQSSDDAAAAASTVGASTSASKSVTWGALSPKSSATLERHRLAQEKQAAEEAEAAALRDAPLTLSAQQLATLRPALSRRRSSDPTSNRPVVRRSHPDSDSDSDSDIEVLPDRFDPNGRPIDGRRLGPPQSYHRSGTFEYRPRRGGDLDVRGAWGIAGSELDDPVVRRIVGDVEGVLSGQKRWTDLLQDVLAARGTQSDHDEEEDDRRRRRRRKHRTG